MVSGCMIRWEAGSAFQVDGVRCVGHTASANLISVRAVGLKWTGVIMVSKDFMTVAECAEYLSYTPNGLRDYIQRHPDFPRRKVGRTIVIPRRAFYQYASEHSLRGVKDANHV